MNCRKLLCWKYSYRNILSDKLRHFLSLIVVGVHTWRGLKRIQSGVIEVASQEMLCEALWSGIVFGRKILLAWLGWAIWHVGGSVEKAAHVETLLGVLYLVGGGRELSWADALLFNRGHSGLDLIINSNIQFTVFSHLLKHLMFVCLQWILQCDFSLSLKNRIGHSWFC